MESVGFMRIYRFSKDIYYSWIEKKTQRARITHNDLWKRYSLKLSVTSIILKRAKSERSCGEKELSSNPHTRSTHSHTCPLPFPQLCNLNATDSLTKTSWADLVIAVYMMGNSFIQRHVERTTWVSKEMNQVERKPGL